jgi:hypothetical protein
MPVWSAALTEAKVGETIGVSRAACAAPPTSDCERMHQLSRALALGLLAVAIVSGYAPDTLGEYPASAFPTANELCLASRGIA